MTVEQIRAALQCCLTSDEYGRRDCCKCSAECGIFEGEEDCTTTILNSTINLINYQSAEIERLRSRDEEFLLKNYSFDKYYDEHIARAKSDAVKEFAERLKGKAHSHSCRYLGNTYAIQAIGIQDIDSLVKDMTEGNENA